MSIRQILKPNDLTLFNKGVSLTTVSATNRDDCTLVAQVGLPIPIFDLEDRPRLTHYNFASYRVSFCANIVVLYNIFPEGLPLEFDLFINGSSATTYLQKSPGTCSCSDIQMGYVANANVTFSLAFTFFVHDLDPLQFLDGAELIFDVRALNFMKDEVTINEKSFSMEVGYTNFNYIPN